MSEFAPRLLWQVEAGGWLALGFEHIKGSHADYAPGSPDLVSLAKVVHRLQDTPCPEAVVMRVERRWQDLAEDVSPIAGDALLHTDLNPANVLLTAAGRAVVVDWGFTSRGAPWVEAAQIIPWLIRAGHGPAAAQQWASQFPSWLAIDLHARLSAERWRLHHAANATPKIPQYVRVAQQWADFRNPGSM
ncbi:phosphotransferase [Actinomadura fulvescens]